MSSAQNPDETLPALPEYQDFAVSTFFAHSRIIASFNLQFEVQAFKNLIALCFDIKITRASTVFVQQNFSYRICVLILSQNAPYFV